VAFGQAIGLPIISAYTGQSVSNHKILPKEAAENRVSGEAISVCAEADGTVTADRQAQYGAPVDNFKRIADAFNALSGGKYAFTPADVAMFMVVVKLARQCHKPKRDNLVDACGYIKCLDMILSGETVGAGH
jgi:hypothetical protein